MRQRRRRQQQQQQRHKQRDSRTGVDVTIVGACTKIRMYVCMYMYARSS